MKLAEIDAAMAARGQPPRRAVAPDPQPEPYYPAQAQMQPQVQQQQQQQTQNDPMQNPWVAALLNMGVAFAGSAGQYLIAKLTNKDTFDPFREIGLANYKVYTEQLSRQAGKMTGSRVGRHDTEGPNEYEEAIQGAVKKYMDTVMKRQLEDENIMLPEVPAAPIEEEQPKPRKKPKRQEQEAEPEPQQESEGVPEYHHSDE